MAKKLKLFTLPQKEKILRSPNREIDFPLSAAIKKLIDNMIVTVQDTPGIGLAAPQIGENLMLAVINLPHLGLEPFAIINPRVVSKSIKKDLMEEGCLSIPGKFCPVKRPAKVEVEAYNTEGKKILIRAGGILAKVLQHEIDHLNAILIIDKFSK